MALEIRIIDNTLESQLSEFFRVIRESGDDKFFHPHPFTDAEAKSLARYSGQDLYYVLIEDNKVIGYAMLRGWDERYDIPSLGIAIHPLARKKGLGKMLISFLHSAAKLRGCNKIRLKVYPENKSAILAYEKLGYVFQPCQGDQLVGLIDL